MLQQRTPDGNTHSPGVASNGVSVSRMLLNHRGLSQSWPAVPGPCPGEGAALEL